MSAHVHYEYAPPRSWDQFEELCADLFQSAWRDPQLVRHGRAGQQQDGVDIVARNGAHYPIGLQCKRRSRWPVTKLTKLEIDAEVAKALKFRPHLKSFYILTTAPDDASIDAHIREINERHKARQMFEVVLLGWSEIVRRVTLERQVADKHFGVYGGGAAQSPLLSTWVMSKGQLEKAGRELELSFHELALDLRDWPDGHVVVRQRESDKLLQEISAIGVAQTTEKRRQQRIELRRRLHRMEKIERFAEDGIKLMLTEPELSSYILDVWEKDAHLTFEAFLNREVVRTTSSNSWPTYLRLHWPDDEAQHASTPITQGDVADILDREREFHKKFGRQMLPLVCELPDNIRAQRAVPRIIREILENVAEGKLTWDQIRKNGHFDVSRWTYSIA